MGIERPREPHDHLQAHLVSLVLPHSPHLVRAAEYLETLGSIWEVATLAEQREITRVLLKAVFVDLEGRRIVSIQPQPIFRVLFTQICADVGIAIV